MTSPGCTSRLGNVFLNAAMPLASIAVSLTLGIFLLRRLQPVRVVQVAEDDGVRRAGLRAGRVRLPVPDRAALVRQLRDLRRDSSLPVIVMTAYGEVEDAVQAMKAGLMEIGDLFVINKADRDGADKLADEIRVNIEVNHATLAGHGPEVEEMVVVQPVHAAPFIE